MSKNELILSARETQVLAHAWQCFESEPKVNITKLAQLCGYTNNSAQVTLGRIKTKLRNAASASDTPAGTPKNTPSGGKSGGRPKTPGTGGKRGASAAGGGGDTPVDEDSSPSKKQRGSTTKKHGGKGGRGGTKEDDDDDEFANIKIKHEEASGVLRDADELFKSVMGDAAGGNGGYGGEFDDQDD